MIKNTSKKCNSIIQINSMNTTRTLTTSINVHEHRLTTMIDSNVTSDFVSQRLVDRKNLSVKKKVDSYELQVVNEKTFLERMIEKTKSLQVVFQHHHEKLVFDIARMIIYDVVLNMSWLKKHNFIIDWKRESLRFARCDCVITVQSTHRQRSMIDEKLSWNSITKRELVTSNKNDKLTRFDFTNIDIDYSSQNVRVIKKNHAFFKILKTTDTMKKSLKKISIAYRAWIDLFQEKKSTKALFKHQSWNHKIKFKSEKQFTFEFIYQLFEKKLEVFRDYIKKNLKKEYIRSSKSSTKYSILFAFKKNEKLCLCVDYRKFNDITIKNHYFLFNVSEIQDKLSQTTIFTKLNLRDEYHFIRIKKKKKWKTVFRTRYEHYKYTIMSFEFTNVLIIF